MWIFLLNFVRLIKKKKKNLRYKTGCRKYLERREMLYLSAWLLEEAFSAPETLSVGPSSLAVV